MAVVLVDGGAGVSSPKSATDSNPGGAGRANTYAYGPSNPVTYAAGGGAVQLLVLPLPLVLTMELLQQVAVVLVEQPFCWIIWW